MQTEAAVNLHFSHRRDVLQVIFHAAKSPKLGHEFAVSAPRDLCGSSHANSTTSLQPNTSKTNICSKP